MEQLKCEMKDDCAEPVTHIGEKGYVYCAGCVPCRAGWERCRKLRPFELKLLRDGEALPSYRPLSKAETIAKVRAAK